jgi:alkylated DNA repair dioxygenase AlkB
MLFPASFLQRGENGVRLDWPDADISYWPLWLEHPDQWFEELVREIPWQQPTIRLYGREYLQPRLVAWVGDPEASYTYSRRQYSPLPWSEKLFQLRERLNAFCCLPRPFNSVLANLYRDGQDSMGSHADDEPELGTEPVIASLTLGATRKLVFRHKTRGLRHVLHPVSGSLLLMAGTTQAYWQHELPKTRQPVAPRLNLTYRTILNL